MGLNRVKALRNGPKIEEPKEHNLINKTTGRVEAGKQTGSSKSGQSICRTQIFLSRPKTGFKDIYSNETDTISKN